MSEEEEVIVHDIIQARGRTLSEGDRITDYQSCKLTLQDTQRLQKVKGIWLPTCRESWMNVDDIEEFQLQPKHLELMKASLRVLYIGYGYKLDGESNETFLNQGSLSDCFGQLKFLRLLHFDHWRNLKRLPESFGNLSALKMLNLSGSSINCLPNSFGLLSRLEELDMSDCGSLASLPQSFSQLSRLKKLTMFACVRLSRLPDGFGQLKSLTHLTMCYCWNLEMVSDDFGQLSSVCAVDASACSRLDGKAMDKLVEMKSLLFLNIQESPVLIERWREVKATHPLIVWEEGFSFEYPMSSALFHKDSKFLRNDGDLYLAEWSPGHGQGVVFVLSICDLSSPSNKAALERVKQEIAELASEGIDIVYVSMVENMEGIRQTLLHLPCGTHAWIAPHHKSNKLLGFSIYRLSWNEVPSRYHTLLSPEPSCLLTKREKSM